MPFPSLFSMACELSMYVEGVADLCFLPPRSYAPFAVGGRGQIEILGVSVLASMEAASPCASSGSAGHQEVSSSDDLPVQQSLLLSDGLEVLL